MLVNIPPHTNSSPMTRIIQARNVRGDRIERDYIFTVLFVKYCFPKALTCWES